MRASRYEIPIFLAAVAAIAIYNAAVLVPDPALAGASRDVTVAVLLREEAGVSREEVARGIADAGGLVAHAFDGFLIARVSPERLAAVRRIRGVEEVASRPVPATRHGDRSEGFRMGVEAWNLFFQREGERIGLFLRDGDPPPPPSGQDSWIPPASWKVHGTSEGAAGGEGSGSTTLDRAAGEGAARPSSSQPYGATSSNTSEYLAGTVSVNVFLVESDGSVDPSTEDWTSDREAAVVAGITAGFDWLRAQEPAARLSFVYHVIAGRTDSRGRTGYEPISRKADPMGTTGEDLWVNQILAKMGFASGDRWTRSRALANATRQADHTDWAVNVFVADSYRDPDGRFADSYFAYAWIGGPHLVMTYDNQAWGIDRMNQVSRHEILHSFFAFDEYTGSGCNCTEHIGYLDGPNANCRPCNSSAVSCVMDSNGPSVCTHTRRQIGWADLDGDGVIDVVGQDPETVLDEVPAAVCGGLSLHGSSVVVAATNRNPSGITPAASISVNRVAGVEVRVDSGPWQPASASDGSWNGYEEDFVGELDLSPGSHAIDVRAADDHGNVDVSPSRAALQVLPGAADPGKTVRGARESGGGARLTWEAAPGAAAYRVYRASRPSGSWTCAAEVAATSWTDTVTGRGFFLVRAVDACGNETAP